jgi:transcription antitermination factor NusG
MDPNSRAQESGWWALYTRHQHEKVVAAVLSAKGCDAFLPLYESLRQWKDRKTVVSLPLFPGYVFVRSCGDRLRVLSTPGVHMILAKGEHDALLAEEEIDAIRRSVAEPRRVEPHPFLQCGERVRVLRGPLQGVTGILVRKKGHVRLVLSVEMLAQSVGVEMSAMDVEPVQMGGPRSISPAFTAA